MIVNPAEPTVHRGRLYGRTATSRYLRHLPRGALGLGVLLVLCTDLAAAVLLAAGPGPGAPRAGWALIVAANAATVLGLACTGRRRR